MNRFKKFLLVSFVGVTALCTAMAAACGSDNGTDGGEHDKDEVHLHTIYKVNEKESSCTETGNTAYWTCDGCGKYFSDEDGEHETTLAAVTVAKKSHTMTHHDEVEANTEHGGNIEYWTCDVCNKYFTDEAGEHETTADGVKTDKKKPEEEGHTHAMTKTEANPGDCENEGNIEYWYCGGCEKYFTDEAGEHETTLAETGTGLGSHKLEKTDANSATCTKDGNIDYWTCEVCGKYFEDDNGVNEIELEDTVTTAPHTPVNHPAVTAWQTNGNIEYWTCDVCGKYFSDSDCTDEINEADTVIEAVAVPDTSGDEDVDNYDGSGNKIDFWTPTKWSTFGSGNYGAVGTAVPTLEDADGDKYLSFTKAARFDLFRVKGEGNTYTHLGENPQTGNSQWGNTTNFSGLYDNTFIYTFDVTATGPFAFEVFGLQGGKTDRTGQGTSLLFNKNIITFSAGSSNGNNNQTVRAIATLPEGFNMGDGGHHIITLSIKRSAPDTSRTDIRTITEFKVYIDGYMVRFASQVGGDWNIADSDGILQISVGKDSGMGQRLSVIPEVNSEESADVTTYSEVRIYSLTIKRHYPETVEDTNSVLEQSVQASLNEFVPEEKLDY